MFKSNNNSGTEMPKQILEIQDLKQMEAIHDEILDILFERHNLSLPSAVGLLELVKNDIMNNPDLFDGSEDFDPDEN